MAVTASPTHALPVSHDFRSEARQLVQLAWPLIVAQLAQMAMGVVGTLAAGRLGVRALAAQALGATVFILVLITAFGLMAGVDPHVSRAMGAGDFDRAGRLFRQGLWLSLFAGIPLTAVVLVAPQVLVAMGQEPELVTNTALYLKFAALGVIPGMIYAMCRSFASAVGKTRAVMVVAIVGNGLHAAMAFAWAVSDPSDVAGGLLNLGLATLVCRVLMAVLLLAWVQWAPTFRAVQAPYGWPRVHELGPILRSGLPLGLQYGLEVTGFVLTTLWMGLLGAEVLAAHEVALTTAAIAFQVPFSLGTAAAMRLGHAVGRRDAPGLRRAGWTAFVLGIAFAVLSGVVMLLSRVWIAHAYLPDAPAAVLALSVHFLAIGAAFQLADAVQAIGFGVLRGLDDTRLPVVFNVLGFALLGLPMGYVTVFVYHQHPDRLWWGLSLALAVVAAALMLRFWWWTHNTHRVVGMTEPATAPATRSFAI